MGSTATGVGQPWGQGEIDVGSRCKSFEATAVTGIGLSFPSPSSFRGLSGVSCTGHRGLATTSGFTGGGSCKTVNFSTQVKLPGNTALSWCSPVLHTEAIQTLISSKGLG